MSGSFCFHLAPGPLESPSGRFSSTLCLGTPCSFARTSLFRLKAMLCTCALQQAPRGV